MNRFALLVVALDLAVGTIAACKPQSAPADAVDAAAATPEATMRTRAQADTPDAPRVEVETAAVYPASHLARQARYPSFTDIAAVGTHAVLIACDHLRVLGPEARDLPVPLRKRPGMSDCLEQVADDDARLFLNSGEERTTAYDVEARRVAWTASSWTRLAVVAGPVIALVGLAPEITALDRVTGAVRWKAGPPDGGAVIATDLELAAAGDLLVERGSGTRHVVRARDAADGKVVWEASIEGDDGGVRRTPGLVADADLVAALAEGAAGPRLVLLDARTGKARPARPLEDVTLHDSATLRMADGKLYIIVAHDDASTTVQRLDRTTGARLWQAKNVGDTIVGAQDALVTRGPGDVLRALDVATGAVVWSFGIGSLRAPGASSSTSLHVVPDSAHPGQLLVAAGVPDGVTTFARGDDAVAPRTAKVDVRIVADGGVVYPDPEREYFVYGTRMKSNDDGGLVTTVTGRGVVEVSPILTSAGDSLQDRAFDLETGKPTYRVQIPFDPNYEQACH